MAKEMKTEEVPLHNYVVGENARSNLEFRSKMDVFGTRKLTCATRIIATIGPACSNPNIIKQMIQNGMAVARLNMAYNDQDHYKKMIDMIREVSSTFAPRQTAIALDTRGPGIRTGKTPDNKDIVIETDSIVVLTSDDKYKEKCSPYTIYVDFKDFAQYCQGGQRILLADGSIVLKITRILFDGEVECMVLAGGSLGSNKNCCIQRCLINLPSLSEKDISDIEFAARNDVDIIFASFVRNAKNIEDIRNTIRRVDENSKLKVIAKVENREGIRNIDEIITASDGILVSRADLGMDLSPSKVLVAQKMIISKCNLACKPVIVAAQMMDTMVYNNRPSRAEVTDIGNAVLDGTDCVMLSGETAVGKYPEVVVKKVGKVCTESEDVISYRMIYENVRDNSKNMTSYQAVSMGAASISFKLHADAIVVLSSSGRTAAMVSHFRPSCPIVVITRDTTIARQLGLWKNIFAYVYPEPQNHMWEQDVDNRLDYGLKCAKTLGVIQPDSYVVFVCGWQRGPGHSNTLRILNVGSDDTVKGMSKVHSKNRLGDL